MPIYNYSCKDCGHTDEDYYSVKYLTEEDVVKCPKCTSDNFKRVWDTGFIPKTGQDAFSFGQRSWKKGLNTEQQASKVYEHAFGRQ